MLLGIDIGTSACKAAVFLKNGEIVASASAPYPVYYPQENYAEQNPDEWYAAVCDALKEIGKTVDLREIEGIGIDGQSWSAIPIDKNGKVLYNTPIWYDNRSTAECEEIEKTVGFERVYAACKNPIKPCYTTPKVLWFKKNYPEVYENAHYFLQSNSFIAYRLTGKVSQDKSMGYGHFFYDMARGVYDEELARDMGIDIAKFPPIVECSDVVGEVTEEAARLTGLAVGTKVVAGGLDAACGTLGVGVIHSGEVQEQGGQAGGMSICMDKPVGEKSLILGSHVVPGMWLLQGGTTAGGASMEWFTKEFGKAFADAKVFRAIDEEASRVPPASEGLIFLPYLNGERSPIWDANAKGVYYGITFSKTKAHFARATMEGVAMSLRHNLEVAESAGASFGTLYSMGGSSKSDVWMQIKSDVCGHPMKVCASDNASTFGAAILAGIGVGVYRDFDEAVSYLPKEGKEYFPNETAHAAYDGAYRKYLEVYQCLKGVMAK